MHPQTLFRRRMAGFALTSLAAVLGGCDGAVPATPPSSAGVEQASAPAGRPVASERSAVDAVLADAIRTRARDVWVSGSGTVIRVLGDDTDGSPHQRFLIRLADGTTVLVAHNIELAPRLAGLQAGEAVEFRGEYIWSGQGGTLHWTHRDPDGDSPGGWLRWRGRTYR